MRHSSFARAHCALKLDAPPDIGLLGLGRVKAELEAILGAKVDLVLATDLKPEVRARAERDLVALCPTRSDSD
jgi:predicted nucleotidyltransferase